MVGMEMKELHKGAGTLSQEENEDHENKPVLQIIEHEISPADTIMGLSLKYDAEPQVIKNLNGIFGDISAPVFRLTFKKKLRIPTNRSQPIPTDPAVLEALRRRRAMKEFRDTSKCNSDSETRFYLDSNDWDVSRALSDYQSDCLWEQTKGRPASPTPLPLVTLETQGTSPSALRRRLISSSQD
mmetsp:Transcript_22463/g.37119  ORF Transcript_22463/g.37119 Transcript_22463/m.37119 type:complete len:184 (+) Transcript_22463:58-609(+)